MTYKETRNLLEKLLNENYANFIKALISLEKDIEDENTLDRLYDAYMKDDSVFLLNDEFDSMLNELTDFDRT